MESKRPLLQAPRVELTSAKHKDAKDTLETAHKRITDALAKSRGPSFIPIAHFLRNKHPKTNPLTKDDIIELRKMNHIGCWEKIAPARYGLGIGGGSAMLSTVLIACFEAPINYFLAITLPIGVGCCCVATSAGCICDYCLAQDRVNFSQTLNQYVETLDSTLLLPPASELYKEQENALQSLYDQYEASITNIPDDMMDPVHHSLMRDPYLLECKHTLDKSSLEGWKGAVKDSKVTCPCCRAAIKSPKPDTDLKEKIETHLISSLVKAGILKSPETKHAADSYRLALPPPARPPSPKSG